MTCSQNHLMICVLDEPFGKQWVCTECDQWIDERFTS